MRIDQPKDRDDCLQMFLLNLVLDIYVVDLQGQSRNVDEVEETADHVEALAVLVPLEPDQLSQRLALEDIKLVGLLAHTHQVDAFIHERLALAIEELTKERHQVYHVPNFEKFLACLITRPNFWKQLKIGMSELKDALVVRHRVRHIQVMGRWPLLERKLKLKHFGVEKRSHLNPFFYEFRENLAE
jgi:hypothetical protein